MGNGLDPMDEYVPILAAEQIRMQNAWRLLFNFQPVKCYGLAQDLQDNSRSWSGQDSGDSWYGFTFSYCCICLEMQIVWNIFHTIMCVFDELIWVDIGLKKTSKQSVCGPFCKIVILYYLM